MTDPEIRALLEYHARKLSTLNEEPKIGYGVVSKDKIIESLDRMRQLAKELDT